MLFFKTMFVFFIDIYKARGLLVSLTRQDFKAKYTGNILGLVWAFVQPAMTVFILWFVFSVGFRVKPVGNYPFILWLVTGLIPWFFFAEAWSNATNAILDYKYLVNKIVFRVSLLPVIKIISALIIHLFFIFIIFFFYLNYGFRLTVINFQFVYYLLCTIMLLLGLSWMTSALLVFLRDVGQCISIIIQFGFWATPIFWDLNSIPSKYHIILKLNPVFYIIEGYRETFLYKIWFWEHMKYTGYFWFVTLGMFIMGGFVFKKLRPHFSDVL